MSRVAQSQSQCLMNVFLPKTRWVLIFVTVLRRTGYGDITLIFRHFPTSHLWRFEIIKLTLFLFCVSFSITATATTFRPSSSGCVCQITVAMMPGLGLYLFELFFDRYHSKLDCEDERLDVSKKRKADKIEQGVPCASTATSITSEDINADITSTKCGNSNTGVSNCFN